MTKLRLCAAGVLAALPIFAAPPASADCTIVYEPVLIGGVIVMQAQQHCVGEPPTGTAIADVPPTSSGLDSLCVATAMSLGEDIEEFCAEADDQAAQQITPGMIATAFRLIPLPASKLQVEPPNGRTLVNFDTNFFTTTAPFDTTVTLLGQQVDLHIVPSQFTWQFGDGESSTTAEPGAPYPALDVTHKYFKKGQVTPSVDTTYTAQFRVNGGPWRDVPGTVTIAGAPVGLQVLTATPVLVGYN